MNKEVNRKFLVHFTEEFNNVCGIFEQILFRTNIDSMVWILYYHFIE